MNNEIFYTTQQVEDIAQRAARYAVEQANFGNRIEPSPEGDEDMTKRIKQQVQLNGAQHWITGQTIGDLLNSYLSLCLSQGVVAPPIAVRPPSSSPLFGPYLKNFNEIYKSKQQSLQVSSQEVFYWDATATVGESLLGLKQLFCAKNFLIAWYSTNKFNKILNSSLQNFQILFAKFSKVRKTDTVLLLVQIG